MIRKGDTLFLILIVILVVGGFLIFVSASLGLLARESGDPSRLLMTQIFFGLVPGVLSLIALRFVPPKFVELSVIPAYITTLTLTLLVFVPTFGTTLNGATRWLDVFGITTLQPAEFLKIGVVLFLSSYLSHVQKKVDNPLTGLIPFALIVGIPVIVLLLQPNTSTAIILVVVSLILYILSGAPLKHIGAICAVGLLVLTVLLFMRPYLMDRLLTFIDPARDPLSSGYQLQQSLIAIGRGEVIGRGFGQSVQKFNYLPEPVGDSVFAVYAEEFGFIGTTALIIVFFLFGLRALRIASNAQTRFYMLLGTGLTLLIVFSAYFNISAMLGLIPLSGLPLPFVSHGGSALFATLIAVGILLNIASHQEKRAT